MLDGLGTITLKKRPYTDRVTYETCGNSVYYLEIDRDPTSGVMLELFTINSSRLSHPPSYVNGV